MKKFLSTIALAALALGCQPKDDNNDDALAGLLLLQSLQNPEICSAVSSSGRSDIENVRVTTASSQSQNLFFTPVGETGHSASLIKVISRGNTEIEVNGDFFLNFGGPNFIYLSERCPLNDSQQALATGVRVEGSTTPIPFGMSTVDKKTGITTIGFQNIGIYYILVYDTITPEVKMATSAVSVRRTRN